MILNWIAFVFGLIVSDEDGKYVAQFAPVLQRLLGNQVRQRVMRDRSSVQLCPDLCRKPIQMLGISPKERFKRS